MSDKNWKKLTGGEKHDFEKDGDLVAVLTQVELDVGKNKSILYHFQKEDGKNVIVWGSAVLDRIIKPLPVGTEVKISYLGKKNNPENGRTFKDYEIFSVDQ